MLSANMEKDSNVDDRSQPQKNMSFLTSVASEESRGN
jgi:hypothetical protein